MHSKIIKLQQPPAGDIIQLQEDTGQQLLATSANYFYAEQ